jgi:hypothetical protein
MRKRARIALAVLLVAVVGVVAWEVQRPQEPAYGGRLLTAWLADCNARYGYGPVPEEANQDPAVKAIRHLGTNGLPVLLKMARVIDPPLKSKILALLRKQSLVSIPLRSEDDYHDMACFGFYVLGGIGKDAVPALMDLLDSTNTQVRLNAAWCLGHMVRLQSLPCPSWSGLSVTQAELHESLRSIP